MQTLNAKLSRSAVRALVAGLVLTGLCGTAGAQGNAAPMVASDEPAGLLVFPKLVVDTNGVLNSSGGMGLDTVVQLTNTDTDPTAGAHDVQCWYVNATSYCSNDSARLCETNGDCALPGVCAPSWRVTDFHILLTPGQPVAWRVGSGASFLPCDPINPDPATQFCVTDNSGAIPPTSDPFRGELKCVETDSGDSAIERNDLIGQATIYRVRDGSAAIVDVASYNAIGIQARGPNFVGAPNNVLCLGGPLFDPSNANCPLSEYAGCPAVLILDHFFDGAVSPVNGSIVTTNLTLVPCTENFIGGIGQNLLANQVKTTAQFLVYNEFEQRFSTSTLVDSYKDVQLSDIDTRLGATGNEFSVFAVGVEGTLTGQTRIRGVEGVEADNGHGLLGVAQEFNAKKVCVGGTANVGQACSEDIECVDTGGGICTAVVVGSAAINLNYFGERQQRDEIKLSVPVASGAANNLCQTCSSNLDCGSPMSCSPCSQNCGAGQPDRCAVSTAFVDCGGGVIY